MMKIACLLVLVVASANAGATGGAGGATGGATGAADEDFHHQLTCKDCLAAGGMWSTKTSICAKKCACETCDQSGCLDPAKGATCPVVTTIAPGPVPARTSTTTLTAATGTAATTTKPTGTATTTGTLEKKSCEAVKGSCSKCLRTAGCVFTSTDGCLNDQQLQNKVR